MTIYAPKLPALPTILGVVDARARQTAQKTGRLGVAAVRAVEPAVSGRLRKGTRASVKRSGTGYEVEVRPRDTPRYPNGVTPQQVAVWVEGGTGERGPRHRAIRPRRGHAFRLPHGWTSGAIRGQRPQRPFARARSSSELAAYRTLEEGARLAAGDVERLIGGLV